MKNLCFIIFLVLPLIGLAQQKDLTDTTVFRYGLPVSNDDTTKQIRTDEDLANQWVPVDAKKIPDALRRTLERKEVYDGWEQGQIYYDKSINQYVVRIREAKSIRTYGFSAEGAPVTFAEENILPRDSID
jgi:hypothetical protein